jgi:hypothetical protein
MEMLFVCSQDNQLYWIRTDRKMFNTRRSTQIRLRNAYSLKSKQEGTSTSKIGDQFKTSLTLSGSSDMRGMPCLFYSVQISQKQIHNFLCSSVRHKPTSHHENSLKIEGVHKTNAFTLFEI